MKSIILFSGFFIVLFAGCGNDEDSKNRQIKLEESINSRDYSVKFRAVQELGQIVEQDDIAQEILLNLLFSDDISTGGSDFIFFELTEILGRSKSVITEKLLRAYASCTKGKQQLEKLLIVLGRLGSKAKSAAPFLLRHLDEYKADAEVEGWIRVILANIGYESEENVAIILSDLQGRNERAKAELRMICWTGPKEWIRDSFVTELAEWLRGESNKDLRSDESFLLLMVLATLNKVDEQTAKELNLYIEEYCREEEDEVCMFYRLFLAKVDTKMRPQFLRQGLKIFSFYGPGGDQAVGLGIIAEYLIRPDPNMMKELIEAMNDKDNEVVAGALSMLIVMGFDADQYTPKVIEILKRSSDWKLRRHAARVLAFISKPNDISTLEAIRQREPTEDFSNQFVRDELTETIRILQLEEKKED